MDDVLRVLFDHLRLLFFESKLQGSVVSGLQQLIGLTQKLVWVHNLPDDHGDLINYSLVHR